MGEKTMKASDISVFMTVILLGLSLFAALLLETKMASYFWLEVLFICAAGLFIFAAYFGLWIDEHWAYPLAAIIFAASLINTVWLFYITNTFLTSAFALLVNIAGMVICLASMQRKQEWTGSLETYEVGKKKK